MDAYLVASRPSARHDALCDSGFRQVNAALRAEALRQLRWQHREWTRSLATHASGTPPLVASADHVGFTDALDLLREAGEDVPSWLYQRGSLVRTTEVASGTTANKRLTDLLADLTQVLAWFDPEPSALGQNVPADAGRGPSVVGATAPNPDSTAPGVRIPPGAGAIGGARGNGPSRQSDQGGGSVNWKLTDESSQAATGGWIVGDRVTARATATTVRAGSGGTVVGFSGVGGHPLVDFDGSGRVLIRAEHLRAEHLECDEDAPAEVRSAGRRRSAATARLSATPRPRAVEVPPPPPPDWFDRQPPPPR